MKNILHIMQYHVIPNRAGLTKKMDALFSRVWADWQHFPTPLELVAMTKLTLGTAARPSNTIGHTRLLSHREIWHNHIFRSTRISYTISYSRYISIFHKTHHPNIPQKSFNTTFTIIPRIAHYKLSPVCITIIIIVRNKNLKVHWPYFLEK